MTPNWYKRAHAHLRFESNKRTDSLKLEGALWVIANPLPITLVTVSVLWHLWGPRLGCSWSTWWSRWWSTSYNDGQHNGQHHGQGDGQSDGQGIGQGGRSVTMMVKMKVKVLVKMVMVVMKSMANQVKNNLMQQFLSFFFSSFWMCKSPVALLRSRSNQFRLWGKSWGKNITHLMGSSPV